MNFAFKVVAAIAGIVLITAGTVKALRSSRNRNSEKAERRTLTPEERKQIHLENLKNREPVKTWEERLADLGYTPERIEEMKSDAIRRNYHDGKYHSDRNAEPGSVDNPVVVGMPECSDSLQFSVESGQWVLTDGLGNGWSR